MSSKKYNLKKIKSLPTFEDDLKEKLKDPKFKQGFDLAYKRWGIAREIIEARKKAKMTQKDLAKSLKTSQSFVARVENGGQNLTIDVLSRLADVLSAKLKKPVKFEIVGKI
ncbi:transcriptional regulator [Candidatus Falkowbacteria bacterium CG11_big_fil_rev_8_21_14_0_20_39_10]|uniref:Transcriptional regulator n=1 Tax=Candidatus Falkowbacteria bacterium CG11_big_fil_rev_8_21_14_0_20_39_10 TaxID=1974570 RepID=A0A2M6K8S3_9BACT|nr:MAG: transcriptional regulator [Candidatus Falkowbacteria bacterium CG11_big_fil_rev_8_21_14_0_20_39_10]